MVHVSLLPQSRPLTRSDLDALPDDGHRYELIDGALIVTPAPSWQHQTIVGELHVLLHAACPAHLQVLLARFDVVLALNTVVQPDLLVARRSDLTLRDLPTAPLLAVEVLSPSTRLIDLALKRALRALGRPGLLGGRSRTTVHHGLRPARRRLCRDCGRRRRGHLPA